MHIDTILTLISSLYLLFDINHSLSACDEVDITFLIDTPSIVQNGDNIIDFIASIVWSGSSEYSAFSVVLYGDLIPKDIDNINIISLTQTVNIHQRQEEETLIINKLENTFKQIESLSKIKIDFPEMKSIKLLDAFKQATTQPSVKHKHKKKEMFGEEYKNNNIGKHDGDKAYFIFDYDNKLLISPYNEIELNNYQIKNSNDDMCEIFNHLNNNDMHNNDESIHFIMGRDIDELDIFCNGRDIPQSLMHHNTFMVLAHESVLDDEEFMENIFDITCPAIIETPEFSGDINLGNHNQWIDIKTIITAHLLYVDEGHDETTPNQLDPASYILIKDYIHDDNTFKVNDFLLADKKTFNLLQTNYKFTSAVVKIIRIIPFNENNNNPNYKVLKLYISLPESPEEYIFNAHITGNVPISIPINNDNNYHDESDGHKRLLLMQAGNGREVVQEKTGKNVKLFSYKWSKEYTWKKEGVSTTKIGGGWFSSGPVVTITGRGIIELKAGYEFKINVNAFFKFDWNRSQKKIVIEFKLHGSWSIAAYFYAKLTGEVEAAINNLLNWGKTLTFFAGPVPIIFKPYVALNARVKTIPFSIYGGIHCTYKESFALGYHYNKQQIVDPRYSIVKRNTRYTLWTRKTYENIKSTRDCAILMYNYGSGSGYSCKWFDYNSRYGTCRCKGSTGQLKGYIEAYNGWTAYILNYYCSSNTYESKCSICNDGDISIQTNGGSKSECGKSVFNFWSETNNWICKRCRKVTSHVRTNVNKYPIKQRNVEKKGCTRKFGIGNEKNEDKCPVTKLGFDVIIEPKIGVSLYVVINVYTKLAFVFPFRINIPEKNTAICGDSSGNMCDAKYLQASFTIAARLDWYIGIALDIEALWGSTDNKLALETKVGSFTIMKPKSMGCLALDGILKPLNTFFKGICCSRSRSSQFSANSEIYDNVLSNPLIFEDQYDDKNKQVGFYYGEDFDYYKLKERKHKLGLKLMKKF